MTTENNPVADPSSPTDPSQAGTSAVVTGSAESTAALADNGLLLKIANLQVSLRSPQRGDPPRTVIHDVSMTIAPKESLGVVGESGSGKSMTTRAIMRLLPDGAQTSGRVEFEGREVMSMSRRELATYRATQVGMIYQDPRAHTNPLAQHRRLRHGRGHLDRTDATKGSRRARVRPTAPSGCR